MDARTRIVAVINLLSAAALCAACVGPTPAPSSADAATTRVGSTSSGRGALLKGAEWVVEDIGGGGIIDNSRATLNFRDDGRLAGRGSCNSYTGGWTLTGETLAVSKLASTMMACAPALMEQEHRFLAILQQVQRFEISDTGALVLVARDGRKITARR